MLYSIQLKKNGQKSKASQKIRSDIWAELSLGYCLSSGAEYASIILIFNKYDKSKQDSTAPFLIELGNAILFGYQIQLEAHP